MVMAKMRFKQTKEHIAKRMIGAKKGWFKKGEKAPHWCGFEKEHIPWNKNFTGYSTSKKGQRMLEEAKKKLSKAMKGKRLRLGTHHSKEAKKKMSEAHWQGGKSFEPYGLEFNKALKEQIRERDDHICQECGYTQEQLGYRLPVHHIDYDKKNNNPNNLIALCKSCNSKANFNREDWTKYYQMKLQARISIG